MIAINQSGSGITIQQIRDSVGELELLSRYFNIRAIPTVVKSPLRVDNDASFAIYSKNGVIRYKDLAKGDSGGIFDMLCHKFNMSLKDILEMIYQEVLHGRPIEEKVVAPLSNNVIKEEVSKEIQCSARPIAKHDIVFWEQFGITEKAMRFGRIYPISNVIIITNGVRKTIPCGRYSYAFVEFKDGRQTIKVYSPKGRYKWINGHDSSVIDLWDKLPETGDELIITSSRKDALTLWTNIRIPSISFQSESTIPNKKVMEDLKRRFKKIYVLYDNDFQNEENNGRIFGKRLADEYGLIQVEIPDEFQSKDPSDLYKNTGKEIFIKTITKILNYDFERNYHRSSKC